MTHQSEENTSPAPAQSPEAGPAHDSGTASKQAPCADAPKPAVPLAGFPDRGKASSWLSKVTIGSATLIITVLGVVIAALSWRSTRIQVDIAHSQDVATFWEAQSDLLSQTQVNRDAIGRANSGCVDAYIKIETLVSDGKTANPGIGTPASIDLLRNQLTQFGAAAGEAAKSDAELLSLDVARSSSIAHTEHIADWNDVEMLGKTTTQWANGQSGFCDRLAQLATSELKNPACFDTASDKSRLAEDLQTLRVSPPYLGALQQMISMSAKRDTPK